MIVEMLCIYFCEKEHFLTLDVLVAKWFSQLKLYLSGFDLPGNKMSTFRSYSGSFSLVQYSAIAWYTVIVAWGEE